MAADAPEILAGLGPWATTAYTIGAVAVASILGGWQLNKSRREEKAKTESASASEHEHFDPDELLAAAPITKFLADISDLAATSRIIAEGVKNISATATVFAKTREDGYDEMVVQRAVDERWNELMKRDRDRDERPAPREGRGERRRGSSGWGGNS